MREPAFDSPLRPLIEARAPRRRLQPERDRLRFVDVLRDNHPLDRDPPLGLSLAGARPRLAFDPTAVRAGVVTCGGLCPGLNDVIRGLVMVLWHRYGVRQIDGYRYGYEGLNPDCGHPPLTLTPDTIDGIHQDGGTILGSSRGPQDPAVMADFLNQRGVNLLFTIGGDGTLRGAQALCDEVQRRDLPIAIVGLPKTIDNDIRYVEESFGFQTAFTEAKRAIDAAHTEARAAQNGCGIVKLMGRHSGFIACYATLASSDVNATLIPEVDFPLQGDQGLLPYLEQRMARRKHAVLVVAEGAGQDHCDPSPHTADKSGNRALGDIGPWLKHTLVDHFTQRGQPIAIKYIDPSYQIRGCPATPHDSVYCFRLASHAVHAAMAGFTRMVVSKWHGRYVHLPMDLCTSGRQQVDPTGDLWLSVLESTGQPRWGEMPELIGP